MAIWDGGDKRLIIDGEMVDSSTGNAIAWNESGIGLGAVNHLGTIDGFLDGAFDDLVIYERVLTDAEIDALRARR